VKASQCEYVGEHRCLQLAWWRVQWGWGSLYACATHRESLKRHAERAGMRYEERQLRAGA